MQEREREREREEGGVCITHSQTHTHTLIQLVVTLCARKSNCGHVTRSLPLSLILLQASGSDTSPMTSFTIRGVSILP